MPDPAATAGFSIEVHVDEPADTVSLHFSGELDLANAAAAEEAFERAMQNGASQILVDLSALTFLDSTGIAVFLLAKRGDERDRLRFRPSKSPGVRRVLAVTGVDVALGLADGRANGAAGEAPAGT